MGLPDFFHELGPTQFARTGRSLTPGVKATSRNLEDTTQNFDGELSLVIADEGKFHDCSFAKNAVAFFLGRQSLIDECIFKRFEVGIGIFAEAATQGPNVLSPLQAAAEFPPFRGVRRDQIHDLNLSHSRRGGRYESDRASDHRAWTGHLATTASRLVIAIRTEELLQAVVGSRQLRVTLRKWSNASASEPNV